MCGLLYVRLKRSDVNFLSTFEGALQHIAYRGPDAIGIHHIDNHYFGHARLSIIDLSSRSNQPIINENTILLFKGEIYNYKQLVADAASDTLAIATMLEAGIDISDKLNGMYGIVAYDKRTQVVQILRDFYGEKPIYYYHDDNIFIVSSTIKSITHILKNSFNKKLTINHLALYEYFLCGYVREPKTIYENIYMLSSGHIMELSSEWAIKISNITQRILQNSSLNPTAYALNCLNNSDVKPSLLLSSGVDSAFVLNLMNTSSLNPFRVLTYKSPSNEIDESSAAITNLHKICGNKEIEVALVENHDDLHHLYTEYPALLEQPTSDGINLFNILSLSKKDSTHWRLVILGTGGDELYGGYNSFKNWKKISFLRKLSLIKKLLPKKWQRFFAFPINRYNKEAYYFLYRICHTFMQYTPKNVLNQLFSQFVEEMKKYNLEQTTCAYKNIKIFETFDYMRNQLLRDADNISLFCGYEARNPLLAIDAYHTMPDAKNGMKNLLKNKYGITFGSKKGFTFYSDNNLFQFLSNQIIELNSKYNLLSNSLLENLTNVNVNNHLLVKKMFILLTWLDKNEIEVAQLKSFTI